jgi:ubiquinone/menaquinone biosynthesis C-methylase UbiE
MKIRNPGSRYDLSIQSGDKVLEVGGGHNPHPRSNLVVDKFTDTNYHRKADIKVLKNQEFLQADGEHLPFKDKEFDYVICNQVLEHVDNPGRFLDEQSRVARKGYIEVPSLIGEYLFPKESHQWVILEFDNKLVLVRKDKVFNKTKVDLGFLFLTYLQKTSIGYKMLSMSYPNLKTIRYEWNDHIDYVVDPDDQEIMKYFQGYWDEEMVKRFFPPRRKINEFLHSLAIFIKITLKAAARN